MAASGVPDLDPRHAEKLAALALDMQRCIATTTVFGQPMQLRIGIHSGPLSAGVINCRRQTYDVWGDTVNTAARLQSSAGSGEIWISEDTTNLLPPDFITKQQGEVALKGLGSMTVYSLQSGRRAHPTDSPRETAESQPRQPHPYRLG